jgi:hypothetical protein
VDELCGANEAGIRSKIQANAWVVVGGGGLKVEREDEDG